LINPFPLFIIRILGETIGVGSSGKVKMAIHKHTGEKAVVKIVPRPKLSFNTNTAITTTPISRNTMTTHDGEKSTLTSPYHDGYDDVDNNMYSNSDYKKLHEKELYIIREAYISKILVHPYIPQLITSVLGTTHFYFVFPYIPGIDLVDYVSDQGKLSEDEARNIIRMVGSAVEYLHRNGIVHRVSFKI